MATKLPENVRLCSLLLECPKGAHWSGPDASNLLELERQGYVAGVAAKPGSEFVRFSLTRTGRNARNLLRCAIECSGMMYKMLMSCMSDEGKRVQETSAQHRYLQMLVLVEYLTSQRMADGTTLFLLTAKGRDKRDRIREVLHSQTRAAGGKCGCGSAADGPMCAQCEMEREHTACQG